MNLIKSKALILMLSMVVLSSCSTSSEQAKKDDSLSGKNKKAIQEKQVTLIEKKEEGVSSAALSRAVQFAVRNMVASGVLNAPSSEKYTLSVTHVLNTSSKAFDVKEIKQMLETTLAVTQKVRVVSSASKKVIPQINVSARITERVAYVRSGKKRQEYYLNLILTEPNAGMTLWSNSTPIIKK